MPTKTDWDEETLGQLERNLAIAICDAPTPDHHHFLMTVQDAITELRARLAEVKKERNRYREALEWYADPDKYWAYDDEPESAYGRDDGRRARKALQGGENQHENGEK